MTHPTKQEVKMLARGYVCVIKAAELAGVHPVSVRRWMAAHKVETTRVGRRVFISLKSLREHQVLAIPDQMPPAVAPSVAA